MIEIKDFSLESTHYIGTEEDLLKESEVLKAKQVHDYLTLNGYCYVRVISGDYKGSIAKFTLDSPIGTEKLYRKVPCDEEVFIVKYLWYGKLSWKGKRNNPKFKLSSSSCDVLLGYTGETELIRIDLKKIKKDLLDKEVVDVDGNKLSVGDKVIYMNLRYGNGGALCRGTIIDFKAYAREGRASVIIENNKNPNENSELNYPRLQVMKQ